MATIDADLGRMRIELVEMESRATQARESAHSCELSINRQQQQIAFDREQTQSLEARTVAVAADFPRSPARRGVDR